MTDTDFDAPKNSGFKLGGSNFTLAALLILLIGALIFIAWLVNSQNKLRKDAQSLKTKSESLEKDNTNFKVAIDSLNDLSIKLEKQLDDLTTQKEKLISSRDSVARLLAYSRTNERNSQAKIAQLQKKLNDLQAKLTDVQKKYDEVMAMSNSTDAELKRQVQALTAERNALASENQRLQRELQSATGNADNRTALFSNKMAALPGEILRGKFSASTRSQNTDRVRVNFTLSRAPKPTESLIFKVFDSSSKEVAIKPVYRNELNAPANPTNQSVILEFENGKLDRRASGIYSVRLYMTDVNKGLENQEIGITQFELK